MSGVFAVKGDAVNVAGKRIPISVLALGVAGVGAFLLLRGHKTAAVSAGTLPTSPYDALAGGTYDPNALNTGGVAGIAGGATTSAPDPVAAFQAWFVPAVRSDLRPQAGESIGSYVSRVLTEFTSETSLVAAQSSVYGIVITAYGGYPPAVTTQPNPGAGTTPPDDRGAPHPAATGPAARHMTVTKWPTPGSTLSGIAQIMYGDASKWPRIYQANQALIGPNPNLIQPGWDLLVP
jgi:nucleoid-associated protein YgaU